MWSQGEKQLLFGVAYSIWSCVIDVTGLSLVLALVGIGYFCMSIYSQFKEL